MQLVYPDPETENVKAEEPSPDEIREREYRAAAVWDAFAVVTVGFLLTAVVEAFFPRNHAESVCATGLILTIIAAIITYALSVEIRAWRDDLTRWTESDEGDN